MRNANLRICAEHGQAMAELVIILPLLMILVTASMMVTYMCWQGVKVQQAANLAARIQGQERVAGGTSGNKIDQEGNGVSTAGFRLPGDRYSAVNGNKAGYNIDLRRSVSPAIEREAPIGGSVYAHYYKLVRSMFGAGEQDGLAVLPPVIGNYSDTVKVVRVMKMPQILSLANVGPLPVDGVAYGGEDPYAYSLPRWFDTATSGANSKPFWQSVIQSHNGCQPGSTGC